MSQLDPDWIAEGALFTRSGLCVRAELIDAGFHSLLLACTAPAPIAEVVAAVAAAFPQSHFPELLNRGVASGALVIL
jgi:hypothetical protein